MGPGLASGWGESPAGAARLDDDDEMASVAKSRDELDGILILFYDDQQNITVEAIIWRTRWYTKVICGIK